MTAGALSRCEFTEPPLLVVEIRSPSTALIDLNRKKAAYERFGVPSYLIVNPGLFLVAALSNRWDWYLTEEPAGNVVWCEIEALWGD